MSKADDAIRVIWAIGLNIAFIFAVVQVAVFINTGQAYRFSQCYLQSFEKQ